MEEILQTKIGNKEGNCLAASISSILELDIDDFPELPNKPDGAWNEVANEYLEKIGYCLITITHDKAFPFPIKGYHLICGNNPQLNCGHAIVGKDGKIVFDPSGSPTELENIYYGILLKIID